MTRSELIDRLHQRFPGLKNPDVRLSIQAILDAIGATLQRGDRVEIRGFGSFRNHYRKPRLSRNPKTGERIPTSGGHFPRFKPGMELRARANNKTKTGI